MNSRPTKIVIRYNENDIINSKIAHYMIELFDIAYKQGAIHAHQVADNNVARAFFRQHHRLDCFATLCDVDAFGRVVEGREYTYRNWVMKVSSWAYMCNSVKLITKFVEKAGASFGYPSVLFDVLMDFYLEGMWHYTLLPPQRDLELFVNTRNVLLSSMYQTQRNKRGKKRTTDDWLMKVRQFVYERSQMSRDCEDTQRLRPTAYDNFYLVFKNACLCRNKEIKDKIIAAQNAKIQRERNSPQL